jgi:hypothetical protein
VQQGIAMSLPEARFQNLAAVSLQLTQAIRENLPIAGRPWLKAGQNFWQVLGGLHPIWKRLGHLLWQDDESGAWHRIQAEEVGPEQQGLLTALDEILLGHYGWDIGLTGLTGSTGWPDFPLIDEKLLFELEQQAIKAGAPLMAEQVERSADAPPEAPRKVTWPEVAGRLKLLQAQGRPWKGYAQTAHDFQCSPSTVHKAIQNAPELQAWVSEGQSKKAAMPKARNLSAAQSREANPLDNAAEQEFLETADPELRAAYLAMPPEAQDAYLENRETDKEVNKGGKVYLKPLTRRKQRKP